MEVLLLSDIKGIGRKNDLIVVASGFALNHLLPERKAIVATPNVRKQYAEHIKKRATEREQERQMQASIAGALSGKIVHIAAKASKAGKLYAAVSVQQIADALNAEHSITIAPEAITIGEHIKSVGPHTVTLSIGTQSTSISIDVQPSEEKAQKA